jgi:alpha-galactosidase
MASVVLAGLMLVAANGATGAEKAAPAESPKNEEMKMKNQWVQDHLTDAKAKLPFSFVYGGKPSEALLAEWPKKIEEKKLDANRTEHTLRWTDPKSGLEVRCVAVDYSDYSAVEWTVYFRNTGSNDTPIMSTIQGLDSHFQRDATGEFVLNGIKGDWCTQDSYEPYQVTLGPSASRTFAPQGTSGKSCDGPGGWPYFNLQMSGGGLILAVGWPGQWQTSFARDASTGMTIRAGQQLTSLLLHPSEVVRTPLIALLFWDGTDLVRAQNTWRRWYLAHNMPRVNGNLPTPQAQIQVGGAERDTNYVQSFFDAGINVDLCWRDAGGGETWYKNNESPYKGGDDWLNTGTWEVDPAKYPNGFKPFSDWIHGKGLKFVLWFEPERVGDPKSWLGLNHPEWLMSPGSVGTILNEGNPAAFNWLTNHFDNLIKANGVDWYREDMNGGGPGPTWRANDASNRKGITENFYVQGHLAFWDGLLAMNPGLRIDSCASGGRRNDLETMRRAVPLLRSDYQWTTLPGNIHDGNQGHTYGLSSWLPFQGQGVYQYDPYSFRSFYMASFGMGGLNSSNRAAQQQAYAECRIVAPCMLYGDYYPLTPYSLAADQWIAWQFHRPEQGNGVIQAFRRAGAGAEELRCKLRGLEAEAIYELTDFDKTEKVKMSGRELMATGLSVHLPPRGSAILTYARLTAVIDATPTIGELPLPVRFSGATSRCASGTLASYDWDFGDGTTARGATAAHTYTKTGAYTASLTVKDGQGHAAMADLRIIVTPVDLTAPTLVDATVPNRSDRVLLRFSKPLRQEDAEVIANYKIEPGIKVLSAALADDRMTVKLVTSPLAFEGEYTVTVGNLRDRARKPNVMAAATRKTFRFSVVWARWKLNEGKGGVAADTSGNRLDGVLKGGPTWDTVDGRAALRFDGVDDIVDLPTKLESLTVPFSIALWVNPAAEQVEYANILGNHTGPLGLVMQQNGNTTNRFGFGYGDGKQYYGPGSAQLTAGRWQHVVVVCDDEKSFFYVNGEGTASAPAKGVFAHNPNLTFRLGQGFGSGRFFRGLLSDVRIYRIALSPAEVQAVMKEDGTEMK